jgi:general secretion pathway protein J
MKNQKGFTLIEVMVAISLLAVISFLVFQAMGTTTSAKERFEKKDETFRMANLALNRMSRDISMAVLFATPDFLGLSPGSELRTKNVFIGVNSGDQDKLTFDTLSHIRYLKDVKESDMAEVSYYLEKQEPSAETENSPSAGLYTLRKRELSPPGPDPETETKGTVLTLLEGVKELNFRYYSQQKIDFVDEWDSTKGDWLNKLPKAVEITLVVQDPVDQEGELRFTTTTFLEMAPGPSDFK